MNIDVLATLRAAADSALELSFLENRRNRLGRKTRLLPNVIEVGDISTDQFLGRKSASIYTLVAAGDDSMKVSGKDKNRV
jgi:hypothetical protein